MHRVYIKQWKGKWKVKPRGFNKAKRRELWSNSLGDSRELNIKLNLLMDADREREASCHPDVLVFLHGWGHLTTRLLLSTRQPETLHFFCKICCSSNVCFFCFFSTSFFECGKPSFLEICVHTHVFGLSLAGMHEFNNRVCLLCHSTFSSWDRWMVMSQQLLNLVHSYTKIKKRVVRNQALVPSNIVPSLKVNFT